MDYKFKEENYKNYLIEVFYDEFSESPREWDNLGTIYSNHRDYDFDGHKIDELGYDADEINETLKGMYWLPIYAYIHSGITISTSNAKYPYNDSWDSGLFGIIAVPKDNKEIASFKTEENVYNCLRGEIATLDEYLRGYCYGYRVTNKYGEEVESCWGFIGEDVVELEIIPEAKSVIDTIIEEEEKLEKKSGKFTIAIEVEYLYTENGKQLNESMIREIAKNLALNPNYNTRDCGVELVDVNEVDTDMVRY